MDPETGVFNCPLGGSYMFVFHIATHDNKKALLSIRLNGEEVASVFDQNHKDNPKNSMAGTTIVLGLKKGDEVCVYAYTGTWLADFPMNHYTHWVGILLKPSQEEEDNFLKVAEDLGILHVRPPCRVRGPSTGSPVGPAGFHGHVHRNRAQASNITATARAAPT